MRPLEFKSGELVKLGPFLWNNIFHDEKCKLFYPAPILENQIALYIEKCYTDDGILYHKIMFDNNFYFIYDNSNGILEDSRRNLQKVLI